jgi:transcription initiation factor TFIIIB Brf1 subunit/transcription initiation factor TFIIB
MAKCPRCGKDKFTEEYAVFSETVSFIVCASCGTAIGAYPQDAGNAMREITGRLDSLLAHFGIR